MLKRFLLVLPACLLLASPRAGAAGDFELLSRSLVEGPARAVCIFDRGVILGTGAGIAVFGGADSLGAPALLPIDGKPYDICVKGNVAYVAAFEAGLEAIDVSDPRRPVEIFSYRAPLATCCAIGGNRLYVADQNQLLIFDISNPLAPVFKGKKVVRQNDAMVSLAAERDLVCVATKQYCAVYRVVPGDTLEKLTEIRPEFGIRKVGLRDRVLCFLSSRGRLEWRDLGARGKPPAGELHELKDLIDFGLTESGGVLLTRALDIVPFTISRVSTSEGESTTACLTIGKRITQLNLKSHVLASEPGSEPVLALDRAFSTSHPGNRFALVWPLGGLSLFVLEQNRVRHLGRFETSGYALNVVASRGILYVANNFDGVRIGEARGNGTVDWVGRIAVEEARDIALAGNNLVIANGKYGLAIADVSDPRRPKIIGTNSPRRILDKLIDDFGGRPRESDYYLSALVVRGTKVYCAGGFRGVEIFDISDARRPTVVSYDQFSRYQFSEVRGIDVDDRYLYVADGYDGFHIFSLDASRSTPAASLKTGGWNCGCTVAGNTLYLANGGSGVAAADVGDRKHPRMLGSISIGSIAREVFVLGETLFVAGERSGVAAVDASDPQKLSISARFKAADDARGVFADENFVYLASGEGGVYVFRYNE